ncbi:MAG: ankyrin repeat domain-containing protein [Actinomycetota bacterium]|nr:ankyrin repeat domain-containing protein [Actinomycetota bacterium]
MTALFDALRAGDAALVRELLSDSPDMARSRTDDGVSATLWALYVGEPALAAAIAETAGHLDVFEAAALGDVARLEELLGASPELATALTGDGFTALHLAAFFGQAAAAPALLGAGAAVDATSGNHMRVTPLHSAAAGRHPDVVAVLLAAGADPTARQNGGFTPLHAAAMNGDADSVRALLAAGADPHEPADDGRTPAQLATDSVAGLLDV